VAAGVNDAVSVPYPVSAVELEALSPGNVRDAVCRIGESAVMRGSPKLYTLLRFLVEATLKGHAAELKETTIGVEAFGRATDYDPKTDTVVRTQTWRLRRKLRTYYSAEGTSDPVLIEIPIGHYVPVFHSRGV
jgi:hypothetical protein